MNMNAIECKDSYIVTDDNGDIKCIAKNNHDKELLDILNKENIKEKLLGEARNLKDKKDNLKTFIFLTPILHLGITAVLLTPPIALLSESIIAFDTLVAIILAIIGISLACIPLTRKKFKKDKDKINYCIYKIKENVNEIKKLNKEIKNLKKNIKYQEIAFYEANDYYLKV